MLYKCLGLLIALIDFICEVAHLKRACVLLCHGLDTLLHVVKLIHILANLFVLLVHILLNLDGKLVKGAFSRVLQALPLEITDVLCIWRYNNRTAKTIKDRKVMAQFQSSTYFQVRSS